MPKKITLIERAVEQFKLIKDCDHNFQDRPARVLGRVIKPETIDGEYYLVCEKCGLLKSRKDIQKETNQNG